MKSGFLAKKPRENFPDEGWNRGFFRCPLLYIKPLAKASGGCAPTIRRHQGRVYGAGATGRAPSTSRLMALPPVSPIVNAST